MRRYLKVWWMMTSATSQKAFSSRFGAIIFLIGKVLRFLIFFFFLLLLVSKTKTIAGYSVWQVIFFYATFNLIDALPQFFLREVYRFRSYVVSGSFDYILTKPTSPLFRSLFGGSDILDLSILLIAGIFLFVALGKIGEISLFGLAAYIILLINAFLIALAFHVLVLALGVLTTEVDNTLWLYRDVTQMGRIPIDVYLEPLRGFITFIIPVGVMMTFPPKALMGLLSPQLILLALLISGVILFLSLRFWSYALRHYSSASS